MNDVIKLAVDMYKGHVAGNYSVSDSNEVIRQALIEANGGSTTLDFRAVRDGQCNKLFALIEEIITKTVIEGLPDSCPLFNYVDFRNLAEGDTNVFEIEDGGLFFVAEIADGTQGLRRQRMEGGEELTIRTKLKGIKIYEELRRILAGRVDILKMIDKVSESFQKQINNDIYAVVVGAFEGLVAPFKESGSFDEAKLTTIIDHVEAATGQTAKIIGSKQAVRKITGVKGSDSDSAKEDLYAMGYYGHFYNTPILVMNNAHKVGSKEFILGDDLYIVAGEDKFVKFVTEGDTLIINGNPLDNADLSQEYLMAMRYGMKVIFASEGFGHYALS